MDSSNKDAIIIGAGHNGLVCAAYLAQSGMDVLVLERSNYVGGACLTQELFPGFHFSTFAYTAHGPGPKICGDLGIPAEAFELISPDPGMQLYPDGDRLIVWRDIEKSARELERFSLHDSRALPGYLEACQRALRICSEMFLEDPPTFEELRRRWSEPKDAAMLELLLNGSLWDLITQFFDNDKVRTAFARADDAGPTNYRGSALAEFLESASTGLGIQNKTGLLRQGMGRITEVLAERATDFGASIRLNADVRRILVRDNISHGVELQSGEEIYSTIVISNADPKRTFLKLLRQTDLNSEFRKSVINLKTRATYMKFHAALADLPHFKALSPNECDDPYLSSSARILPSLKYMEASWQDCISGRMPLNPIISLQIPTVYWPCQAPEGKHILGAWIRWAPSRLIDGSSWEDRRQEMTDRIVAIIDDYAPGFSDSVEWCRLYTPSDIESVTGITDASIRHLDMTLDQILDRRPLPGWSRYKSPIDGLWLCGSGTHPCGSVTGGPGHNCANAILRTAKFNSSHAPI